MAREQLGVDVREGTIEEDDLGEERYEAITLWHVLEHIPDPVPQLRRLARALVPGGVLALEVPNAGSAVARHTGSGWGSLEPDVHVNQFSPSTLRGALERAGLDVHDLRTIAISPYLAPRVRVSPRHLLGRAKAALWLRDPRSEHPDGLELLRAVATRPRQRAGRPDRDLSISGGGARPGA
jgi:SAM-dependent methyltransferase